MSQTATHPPVKYVAKVYGSREVTLYGKANPDYWQKKLAHEQLLPYVDNGHAQVIIIAVASRWSGVRFSELIVGVVTADEPSGPANGMFLLAGYNTSPVFTFFEYYYFGTPYSHANVAVECDKQILMGLSRGGKTALSAERSSSDRTSRTESVDWKGPAYLPRGSAKVGKVYYVHIRGETQISPFVAGADAFAIKDASEPALLWLAESGFTPQEWHLRPNAYHARSGTSARPPLRSGS